MAILNNLIVRGATRCLNTLYANSLQVDSQTISGNLTVNGYTYMGYSTSRSDTKLSVAGITNNQWYRSTGSVGWYSDSYGGGIYMTDPTYVKTYNDKAFYAHNGLYTGASVQYYLNSNGKLNAVDGIFSNNLNVGYSIVARNVSVTNTLRAAKYDLQTVTQMGTNGTLYVAPSIQFPTSNTTSVAADSTSITIIDTNITSDVMAGVVWRPSARVKISGTINGVVTGTVDGTITSINTSSKTMVIGNLSGGNWSSVVAGTYTKDKIENLNIMMYETYQNSTYYPVGILLTSYGSVGEHTDGTAKTFIDIFGGSATKPVVRLGSMTGLDAINGVTPNGWGLYTTHGYFSGLIVSNEGKIGGWTLGSNSLTTGTWGTTNSAMLCTGSDISKTIADSGSISGWVFTAGANFGVTKTGAMYCTGAKVNGNITAQSLTIASNATITGSIPQANVTNLSTSLTNAAKTATNFISTVDSTGIMVHPNGNTTTGWKISNAIELLRNNDSHMKLWIDDNSVAKIRIGKEDSKHVLIDDDSVDIVDDETVLASFGETARIGKEDQGHIIIDNDSLDIRDGQKILSSFGERDIIQYDQNGAPIFWVSQFPTTDTMGIRQAVHETIYDTTEIFRRGVKLKYHPQAETKCNFSIIIEDTTDDIISESAFNIPDFESNESNEGEALYDKSITIEVIAEKRSGGDGGTYTYEATLDFNHSYTLFYISNYSFSNTAKVRLILDYINDSSATFYQPYYSFGTRYSYVNAGIYSFVEGYNNTANGKSTHAEGYYTTADGDYSHSEGVLSLASGEMAHAEGYSCTASGNSSHVEGDGTEASNTGAHAEGSGTIASGICSHAQNWQTIAESDYQTALGKYNITDSQNKYAIIVGNGTTGNARSNAYAITWDGDTEFALDVTASSGTLDADLYDAITALGWNINDITV